MNFERVPVAPKEQGNEGMKRLLAVLDEIREHYRHGHRTTDVQFDFPGRGPDQLWENVERSIKEHPEFLEDTEVGRIIAELLRSDDSGALEDGDEPPKKADEDYITKFKERLGEKE